MSPQVQTALVVVIRELYYVHFFRSMHRASLIAYCQSNKSLFSWWTHWNSSRSSLQVKLMLTVSGNPEATGNQKKAKAVIPLWSLREYQERE